MKNYLKALILAAIAVAACTPPAPEEGAKTVNLRVSASSPLDTKASTIKDAQINSIQVFIFSGSGTLEGWKRADGASVEVSSLTGEKIIWAVVNAPEISIAPGESEEVLKAIRSDLKDNSTTSLVMTGRRTYMVSGGGSVSVAVDRIPAKISVGSICVRFQGTSLEGKPFIVKDVYLRNVAGEQNIGGTFVPTKNSLWYNKIVRSSSGASSVIADTGLSITCPENTAKELGFLYLAYPNPTADDARDNSWTSIRRTHLMIHATIGGTDTFYPFALPVIERNHIYNVRSITISMKGNDNESDPPIETGGLGMSVTVNPWNGEDEISYSL